MSCTRRRFFGLAVAGIAPFTTTGARGQQTPQSMFGPMDEERYRPVRLAPKAGAPSMSAEQRDALEHRLHCQCGCTLDIYTCRTTDFSCAVSPAMHRDVMALVDGGHSAEAILGAFTGVYGERVLMAPPKSGFNLAAYVLPFLALAGGALVVGRLIVRWGRDEAPETAHAPPVHATNEELARIEEAVRRDAP